MECECLCPEEQDIPLGSLIQMVCLNDEEVLTCRTLWSDKVLAAAQRACPHGLDIYRIMLTLREEAKARGLVK